MTFNNKPDKFFISNGNMNVLLALIREQRQALLSLNRYTPDNHTLQLLKDDAIRISKISLINKGYNSLTKSLKAELNKEFQEYMAATNAISAAYLVHNQESKKFIDDILAERFASRDTVTQIFSKSETLSQGYVKSTTVDDKEYDIPRTEQIPTDYGHSRTFNVGSGSEIAVSVPAFPEFGMPYDNHMSEISERMSSKEDFNSNSGETIYKGWVAKTKDGKTIADPIRTFTKTTPFSDKISKQIKAEFGTGSKVQPAGTVKFFIEKLHGRFADGSTHKKGELVNQYEVIKDQNFSNRMVFASYIDNISESFSSNWNNYNFIGRGENVPIFQGTNRSLTLSFSIIADYSLDLMVAMEQVYAKLGFQEINEGKIEELIKDRANWGMGYVGLPSVLDGKPYGGNIPGMYSDTTESLWHKLTFLAQCVYPYYRQDGKMKEQPIIRLRIADYLDVTGYITGYSVSNEDCDNMFDLNPSAIGAIPMSAKINLNFTVIHDNEPSENFDGFYHRKEFDNGSADPNTGKGLSNNSRSITADGYGAQSSKQEKLSERSLLANMKESSQQFYKELIGFQSNLSDVKKIGIIASDETRKIKTEKAMNSFVRLSDIADEIGLKYGISPQTQTPGLGNKISNTFSSIFNRDALLGIKSSVQNFVIDEGLDILTGQQTVDGALSNGKLKAGIGVRGLGNRVFSGVLGDVLGTSELNRVGLNNLNSDQVVQAAKDAGAYVKKGKLEPKTIADIINNNRDAIDSSINNI